MQSARLFASKNDDDPKDGSKTDLERFEEQQKAKKNKSGKEKSVFAKNSEDEEETLTRKASKPRKKIITDEQIMDSSASEAIKPKRKRRSKAEMEAAKVEAKLDAATRRVNSYKNKEEALESGEIPEEMYTLKFNSPILPFAKFPLTQNKYIQDFLRSYEEDKPQI